MIHIINKYNRHLYQEVLHAMFQVRHKVFVEEKGWNFLAKEDGLERDQFDTDETIYFLKLDENADIIGGMRLVPTTEPTQLGTIFKEWCHFKEPPQGADVYEWSRYFIVDNTYRSSAGYPVHYELFFAILEYAVAKGLTGLSGFLEAITLPRLNALPWHVEYLGNIVTYGGRHGEPLGKGAAVYVAVDKRMLRITKHLKKVSKPYLALPFGDMAPDRQIACGPDLCFSCLEFLEKHPDQSEILAMVARAVVDCSPEDRETMTQILDNIALEEDARDFVVNMNTVRLSHTAPTALQ